MRRNRCAAAARARQRQHQHHASSSEDMETTSSEASSEETMRCVSCLEEYEAREAGTCKECYEEANDTEEELRRQIEDLSSKLSFLKFPNPQSPRFHTPPFSDVVLIASDHPTPIPAHKAVLVSRSVVFRAMLDNEMEESRSGTIKISDVSYDALRAFVNYLYTAEASLDESLACDLLVLAEKYEVKHLKTFCEKFLVSKLNWDNSVVNYAFAQQHNAKLLLDSALVLITENMDKLTKREEYLELKAKDPRLVVDIYEAYLSKQVNTAAARKDSSQKT